MKSRMIAFAAVVLLAGSVPAFAQTILWTSVPFQFEVGRVVLPAGDYVIRFNNEWMRIEGGDKVHVFVARRDYGTKPKGAKLHFKKTDWGYQLCKVPGVLTKYC